MSEISSLENRITAALDRIRAGLEQRPVAPDPAQTDARDAVLEEERAARVKLEDRLATLSAQHESQLAALTKRAESQKAQLGALDAALATLRAANDRLREMNGQLRAAASEGVSPELCDASLMAELDALEALRKADLAEMDAIIAELKPLMTDA